MGGGVKEKTLTDKKGDKITRKRGEEDAKGEQLLR